VIKSRQSKLVAVAMLGLTATGATWAFETHHLAWGIGGLVTFVGELVVVLVEGSKS